MPTLPTVGADTDTWGTELNTFLSVTLDSTTGNIKSSLAGSGLGLSSNVFAVNVDGATIEVNADTLRIKDGGVTGAKLAAGAVAANLGYTPAADFGGYTPVNQAGDTMTGDLDLGVHTLQAGDIEVASGPYFDVRAYGATGNSSTDDTVAVQAAIDAADNAGGGIVLFPKGGYVLTQIKLKSYVTLQGSGWGTSLQCKANNANAAMITLDSTSVIQTRIRGFFLNGNPTNQIGAVTGIYYQGGTGAPWHVVEDCYAWDWTGRGIDARAQNTYIRHCYVWNSGEEGIYIGFNDAELIDNRVGNSGYEGILIDSAANVQMAECGIWGSGQVNGARGDGVRLLTTGQVKIVNCESSDNMRHGWNFDKCFGCTLIGGGAQDNNASGTGGAAIRMAGFGRHFIRMFCAGGARATESSLLKYDTDGGYPTSCNIELTYAPGTGGAIGNVNPEIVGTVSSDNYIKINERVVSGGLTFSSTNTATGLTMSGTFSSYGIDFNAGTFTGGMIRLKNDAYVVARNTSAADVNLFKFNTLNEFQMLQPSRFQASITVEGGNNFVLATTTGTKIGTSTTQKLGFWNATPVVRPAAYTPTNVTTDRSYDANATTMDELADVLGTLIADLQSVGLIG